MHHTKAVTTSHNPALRFFLLGLAFLLENLWVRLRLSVPRGRLSPVPLRRFITFLIHAIEPLYPPLVSCPLLCFSEPGKD